MPAVRSEEEEIRDMLNEVGISQGNQDELIGEGCNQWQRLILDGEVIVKEEKLTPKYMNSFEAAEFLARLKKRLSS